MKLTHINIIGPSLSPGKQAAKTFKVDLDNESELVGAVAVAIQDAYQRGFEDALHQASNLLLVAWRGYD